MNLEIKKLIPELAEDYVHFFDITPHDVNVDEQKCYCVTWRSDDSYVGNADHWFATREERRQARPAICKERQSARLSCLSRR